MPRPRLFPIPLLAAVALLLAPAAEAATVRFQLRGMGGEGLIPGNVVPPANSAGRGGEIDEGITFDDATNVLTIRAGWGSGQGYADLAGSPLATHLHGPSNTDYNFTVNTTSANDLPLTVSGNATGGTITGTLLLNSTQVAQLFAGRFYLCLHTNSFPGSELRGTLVPETLVTNTNNDGPGSLRQAIALAAVLPGENTVTFDPALSGQTISLNTGTNDSAIEIADANGVTIDATGLAAGLTLDTGGANLRLFALEETGVCTLRGLTLAHALGATTGAGGAILANANSTLTLERCTFSNNAGSGTPRSGGAVANFGTASFTYCTFAGNTASGGQGGAIYNDGTLTLTHCTVAGNSAAEGGGISNSGTLILNYTILASNTAPLGPDLLNSDTIAPGQVSLIGNLSGSGQTAGASLLTGDARLNPAGLADNGGPLRTIALLYDSPAVDAGTGSSSPQDQRGQFASGLPDLGAYELQAQEIGVDDPAGTELVLGSASANFGQVEAFTTKDLVFTIRNKGPGTLTLPGAAPVTISGPDAALFSVHAQPASPVAASGPATFTVRFAPGSPGNHTATLAIANNDADKTPFLITLTGESADTETLPPILNAPGNNALAITTLAVIFTLPEAALAGTGSLELSDGVESTSFPLTTEEETAGPHTKTLDLTGFAYGEYTLTISYQDAAAHPAASATVSPVFVRPEAPINTLAAAKGSAAPGRGTNSLPADAVLASFNLPAIDDAGNLAYVAKWTSNGGKIKGTGLFLNDACLGIIGGDASAVGGAGAKWKTFGDPVIGGGSLGCIATLSGVKSTAGTVVVSNLGTSALLKIAQLGDSGTTDGAKFKAFKNIMAVEGQIAFLAQLATSSTTVPKTTAANDLGIWITGTATPGASTTELVLRKGSLVSGLTIKTLTAFLSTTGSPGAGRGYVIQPDGGGDPQAGAHALFTDKLKKQGLVYQASGENNPTAISIAADPATGHVNGGTFASYGPPVRNRRETTAFLGKLTIGPGVTAATATGIFAGPNGDGKFVTVARLGDSATQGATFSALKDPVLSDDDALAFQATLKGGTVKGLGAQTLWWQPAGEPLTLLAQCGPNAQGAPHDLPAGAQWKSFTSLAIAGGGRGPIFTGTLVPGPGGVKTTDATGVWAMDVTGKIRTLFRTETVIEGKTLKTFTLLKATVGNTGVARSYNNKAKLTWLATFKEDSSQAIIVTELP